MKQQNIIWVFLRTIKQVENKPPLDKAKALESHKICTAIQIPDQARRWTPQKIKAL
jgi:hypothetical protein